MNFSVVLIARNEEKTLPRLLSSLSGFHASGGRVYLCDTGSTDKTVEVAKHWGCEVTEVGDRFRREITEEEANEINEMFVAEEELDVVKAGDKLFDYSSARNFAASLAHTDMIAMPDCDEVFTTLDLDAVNKAIEEGAEQLEYQFVFAHDAAGKPSIEFLHSKFYHRKKLVWTGIIHEILTGEAHRKFLGKEVVYLEHFQNHETNRSGYLKGLALDCYLHPDNDRNSHYFGRELLWTGRPKSAIKELTRHIAMNKWQPERSQSAVYVGEAYKMLGDEEKAVEWWHGAFAIEAGRREPLIRLARHYWSKNDPQRTAAYASAALTIPLSNFYANDLNHYRQEPHELLYWALYALGNREASRYHFDRALEYQPTNSKYLHDYRVDHWLPTVSVILPQLGREEGLARALKSIENLNYPKELIGVTVIEGDETVPEKVKKGVESTTGEFILFAANDVEFHPDSLILAILTAIQKGGYKLVAMNSGTLECEHFIISRDILPELEDGLIFHTDFHHVGVDNYLWAQCDKLGQAARCEEARVEHFHFSQGKGPWDEIYEKGWKNAEKDREVLKLKLAALA